MCILVNADDSYMVMGGLDRFCCVRNDTESFRIAENRIMDDHARIG